MPRRPRYEVPAALPMRDLARLHCVESLKYVGGNKAKCARRLGISRHTLYDLLAEYRAAQPQPVREPSEPTLEERLSEVFQRLRQRSA
jgi:DNA-binding NtrC family response regulator